jgi:hypothetical protein
MNKSLTTLIIASIFTLAACGGGGGDSTTTYSYTGSTAPVAIQSSNAGEIIESTLDTNAMLFDSSIPVMTAVASTTDDTQSHDILGQNQQLTQLVLDKASGTSANQLTGITQTVSCTEGGNITFDGDLAEFQADTFGPGDSLTTHFNQCKESGVVINGSMTLSVISISGDGITAPWEFKFTLSYNQLSINGTDLLMHGSMAYTMGADSVTENHFRIVGSSLFFMSGAQQSLLTNFNVYMHYDSATGDSTVNSDYTYAGTDIGGSIRVDTTASFVINDAYSYPGSGEMTIYGASDAYIYVRAVDPTQVYLEWDLDPIDAIPDGNTTIDWVLLNTWTP